MAYTGQSIENPVSGERIEFLRTAGDTDGELLEFELTLAPTGASPGLTCIRSRRRASTCSRAR